MYSVRGFLAKNEGTRSILGPAENPALNFHRAKLINPDQYFALHNKWSTQLEVFSDWRVFFSFKTNKNTVQCPNFRLGTRIVARGIWSHSFWYQYVKGFRKLAMFTYIVSSYIFFWRFFENVLLLQPAPSTFCCLMSKNSVSIYFEASDRSEKV